MIRISVCKTFVSYGTGASRFVVQLQAEPHGLRSFATLEELAAAFKKAAPKSLPPQEPRYIFNDVPGDIVWCPDDTPNHRVTEYARLSGTELRELAKLLKQ